MQTSPDKWQWHHAMTGLIAVLIGYSSAAILIVQASHAAGANGSTWLWACGVGLGLSTLGLSWYYKTPVLTAWSTPGAALLIVSVPGFSLPEVIGACLISSLIILLLGLSGLMDRLLRNFPPPLAAALLAGILLRFGLNIFSTFPAQPMLVAVMLIVYLLTKKSSPRLCLPLTLLAGLTVCWQQALFQPFQPVWQLAVPSWTMPVISVQAILSIALPLCLITMTAQNMPGLAVLRANGYRIASSPLISVTGLAGVLFAGFGGFAFNLAALTASIVAGPDADPSAATRYRAAIWAGWFYLSFGLAASSILALLLAIPAPMMTTMAGLALLGPLGSSFRQAMQQAETVEPALLTFLITASGINLAGISSPCLGALCGILVYRLQTGLRTQTG